MTIVNVLIPLANGMLVPQQVQDAIMLQTTCCKIVEHSSPLVVTGERLLDKRLNECHNRNMLMSSASIPYALFLNHDVVLGPTDVQDCAEFLDEHMELDAVAINTKRGINIKAQEEDKHVVNACLMIRTSQWGGYQWVATVNRCACRNANEKFSMQYIDTRQREEIDR